MTPAAAPRLWQDTEFRKLWLGQTGSQFGAQTAQLTLTLIAVVTVGASAREVGLLRAVQQAPVFLLALLIGAAVDRVRGRGVMVAADLARALVLAALPICYAVGILGSPALYVAGFLIGVCTVVFDVTYQAYLLRMVRRDQLAEGNSMLEGSRSAAQIGGPALSGLVAALAGPVAAVVSSAFFAFSALSVGRIRRAEAVPQRAGPGTGILRQIGAGMRVVGHDPSLRTIAATACLFNLSHAAFMTVYMLFLPRALGLSGAVLGLCLAALGPGSLIGSLLSARLPRRFGYGAVLIAASVVSDAALLGVAALHGSGPCTIALLMAINFTFGAFAQTVNISIASVRQAITVDEFQGRVAATVRFVALGLTPLGSLLGGFLATQTGLRSGILITALCLFSSPICIALSPLVRLGRRLPEAVPVSGTVPG